MTTSFKSRLLQNTLKNKGRKPNGFTLIEMMVVVVIIGVLSAVGAGELFKAVEASKDTAAKALAVNEAKLCSTELIYNAGVGTGFTAGGAPDGVTYSAPTCAADASFAVTGPSQTWTVDLTSGMPGAPVKS